MTREEDYTISDKWWQEHAEKFHVDCLQVEDVVDRAFWAGARWADKNPHWISVDDSLPKEHQWFLGYSPIKSAMLVDVYNFDSNGLIEAHCITHWMPLPQPPKEDAK